MLNPRSDLDQSWSLTFSVTFQDEFLAHHRWYRGWKTLKRFFSISLILVCLLFVSSLIRVLGFVWRIRVLRSGRSSKMRRTRVVMLIHIAKLKSRGPSLTRKVPGGNPRYRYTTIIPWFFLSFFLFLSIYHELNKYVMFALMFCRYKTAFDK